MVDPELEGVAGAAEPLTATEATEATETTEAAEAEQSAAEADADAEAAAGVQDPDQQTEGANLSPPEPAAGTSIVDPAAASTLHIAALGDMQANRYGLYLHQGQGYGDEQGNGLHALQVVDDLIRLELAVLEPTGGRAGTVKITPAGVQAYRDARAVEPAE